MPKDLLEQVKELEELFAVDQTQLKKIVAHFVKELEKGMRILFETGLELKCADELIYEQVLVWRAAIS